MLSNENNSFLYLPISEENLLWDLYITGIGRAHIHKGQDYPPKGHPEVYDFKWKTGRVLPEYQILFISEGQGVFESLYTGMVEVKAGNVLLLFPGIWHRYRPMMETGWKEYWLGWNGEYLYRLNKRKIIRPEKSVLAVSRSNVIIDTYNKIFNIAAIKPTENAHVLAALGMQILAHALQSIDQDNIQVSGGIVNTKDMIKDEIVAEAVQNIWSHSHRNITVNTVVEELPVTRRTLERKFKRFLGCSIGQEINRCRIERAKHLLINTNLPIEHIALAVGFSGADRLGRVFRRHENSSPREYRKSTRIHSRKS